MPRFVAELVSVFPAIESRERESLFEALFNQSPFGILLANERGMVTHINDAYLAIIGGSIGREDIVGKISILDNPVYQQAGIQDRFYELYRGRQIDVESPVVTTGGRDAFIHYRGIPLQDRNQTVTGAVVIAQDISDWKIAELEQRKLAAKFKGLFENLPAGVVFADSTTGRLLHANKLATEMLGERILPTHEGSWPVRSYGLEREDGSEYPIDALPILRVMASGQQVHVDDLFIRRRDGKRFAIEAWAGPVNWSGGDRFDAVVAVFQDITRRRMIEKTIQDEQTRQKQLQEQMHRSDKSRSIATLAGGVAHDFNNLLVSILGNASMIQSEMSPNHPWFEAMTSIVHGAERAATITRQLLTYARSGKFLPRRVSLRMALMDSLSLCRSAVPKNIRIEFEAEETDDIVEVDSAQVQQILLNLIVNAAEAMPSGGCVRVVSQARSGPVDSSLAGKRTICLRVLDEGCGISVEIADKLFEPFSTTKEFGRGLGLASVFGMVRNHNGEIRYQPRTGGGAEFLIYFPAQPLVA